MTGSADMGEREDNVYKAKLAEQAERYDGKTKIRAFLTNTVIGILVLSHYFLSPLVWLSNERMRCGPSSLTQSRVFAY